MSQDKIPPIGSASAMHFEEHDKVGAILLLLDVLPMTDPNGAAKKMVCHGSHQSTVPHLC